MFVIKLLLPALVAVSVYSLETVRVDLYYETLCPGCIEVYPEFVDIVEKLKEQLELHTLPFGNADIVDNGKSVKCQHGPTECYGEKVHACVIDQLKETEAYVKFNACLMPLDSNDAAVDECAKQFTKVDSASIKACAKSDKGLQLQLAYGKQTLEDMKGHQRYTPYIRINKKQLDPDTDDILQAICAAYKQPPAGCSS